MKNNYLYTRFYRLIIGGFIAGFIATLVFHQGALWVLWSAGLTPMAPYNLTSMPPFGIPAVISLALWGGVWGMILALVQTRFSQWRYWSTTFLFGAIFPTLVALLIVLPLKGRPMGGGWHWQILVTAFLINGVWGLGTGILLKMFSLKGRKIGIDPTTCLPGAVCH